MYIQWPQKALKKKGLMAYVNKSFNMPREKEYIFAQ